MASNRIEIYIDTEDNSKGSFELGVIIAGRKTHVYHTRLQMRKAILAFKVVSVWAHNVQYDISNIFDIKEIEWKYTSGKFIAAVYRKNGCYIRFFDTMNLYAGKLADIGNFIGLKKLEFRKGDPVKYCIRDTKIVKKFVEVIKTMCEKEGITFSFTQGAMSWKAFRKTCALDLKTSSYSSGIARSAYYGGRVEIFRYGRYDGKVYEYDINSMYPYAMSYLTIPYGNLNYGKRLDLVNREGVACLRVESNLQIPLLPYRMDDGLAYPNGKFTGVWAFPEIRRFIELGGKVKKVYWTFSTRKKARKVFTRFVRRYYGLRKRETNEARKMFYKILLNSLYGKFGFKGEVQKLKRLFIGEFTHSKLFFARDGEIYGYDTRDIKTPYQNACIAAYITSEARCNQHKFMMLRPDDLLYTDTDSFMMKTRLPDKYIGKNIGELKLENIHQGADFILPKVYRVGEKVRAKGFKINGVPDFEKLRTTGSITIEKPRKVRQALRTGKKVNYWYKEKKSINAVYMKRIVLKDGETKPLYLFGGKKNGR